MTQKTSTQPSILQRIKSTFIWMAVVGLLGVAIYTPLAYHAVIYEGRLHVVKKDHLTWNNTYLQLDKHPTKWVTVVVPSQTLKSYMAKHYSSQLQRHMQNRGLRIWNKFKRAGKNLGKKLLDQGRKGLVKEGRKRLQKMGKRWKQKLDNAVKEK